MKISHICLPFLRLIITLHNRRSMSSRRENEQRGGFRGAEFPLSSRLRAESAWPERAASSARRPTGTAGFPSRSQVFKVDECPRRACFTVLLVKNRGSRLGNDGRKIPSLITIDTFDRSGTLRVTRCRIYGIAWYAYMGKRAICTRNCISAINITAVVAYKSVLSPGQHCQRAFNSLRN